MNKNIIVAGHPINIGCKVILWDDPDGLSFYDNPKSLHIRDLTLEELNNKLTSFTIHHSVTYKAKITHNVLIQRQLSCNFLIEDDANQDGYATIYQCADVKDACFSQNQMNDFGPGVEITYIPNAWEKPDLYNESKRKILNVQEHPVLTDQIHGMKIKVFGPTNAQVESCIKLIYGVCKACPSILPEFPKQNGNIVKTFVPNPSGLLAHFMINKGKVDPMGFPFEYVEAKVKELLQNDKNKKSLLYEGFKKLKNMFKK
jgi:hypothetical protein